MREVAYQHLHKKIATRELRAGLPVSELSIATELGISRTPTREAMRQLLTEGLLEEIPGRGVVVVTLDRRDIVEIYGIRKALEVQAVRVAAVKLTGQKELENLRQVAERIGEMAQELEQAKCERMDAKEASLFEAADIGFHTFLMQAAGNRRAVRLLNSLRTLIRTFTMRRTGVRVEFLKRIHADHCAVVAAIEAHDPERAAQLLLEHIETGQKERLTQFDEREQEAGLPQDIPAFLQKIQVEIS